MRILQIISTLDPACGGPSEGVLRQSLALQKLGQTVEVATCDSPDAEFLKSTPLTVHALGPSRLNYAYAPELGDWLKSHAHSFDGVVINGLWQYPSLVTAGVMRRLRRPYVIYPHGMLGEYFKEQFPVKHLKKQLYWRWGEYRVLRDAAAVLFTSEDEMMSARRSFQNYAARERVVGYGTSRPASDPDVSLESLVARVPVLTSTRFLLFLGRIHAIKGCDHLVRAFASVYAGSDVVLVMAGPDPGGLRPELEALASSLGVSDQIFWTGMLDGDAKWGAIRAAEALVLPSHHENFGVVVAEALACGTPVLLSNKVGIWREVVAADAGFVAEDTLEGTRDLLERWQSTSAKERENMKVAALKCFEDHFEIGQSARILLQVLHEVSIARSAVSVSC